MEGKTWGNKKSLMKSYNKQFRHANWTPECITQGEEESAILEIHDCSCKKLEAEFKYNIWLTTVHQHVRSKESTRKLLEGKNLRLKSLGCLSPILA